ncbi:MAG: hypothetical protein HRT89_22135, partial [Lentisphaeria bacterium]|nr:hypothetical protein [Lentisphaeria bacterium]
MDQKNDERGRSDYAELRPTAVAGLALGRLCKRIYETVIFREPKPGSCHLISIFNRVLQFTVILLFSASLSSAADESKLPEGVDFSIAVVNAHDGSTKAAVTRLKKNGAKLTILAPNSRLKDLQAFDLVILPTQCAESGVLEGFAKDYQDYVFGGGGLIVCQPNVSRQIKILPYPITFVKNYNSSEKPVAVEKWHPIIRGLPESELTFPADSMKDLDKHYRVLVKGSVSGTPSLVIAEFGTGRILVQTASENPKASKPFSDRLLVRMLIWAANSPVNPGVAAQAQAKALLAKPAELAAGLAVLIEQLVDKDWTKGKLAIEVLVAIGKSGLPALENALTENNDSKSAQRILKLIKDLGDDVFKVRETATAELMKSGSAALPLIKQHADMQDPEIFAR